MRAADQYGVYVERDFTLHVTDANEKPTAATLFGGTVRGHVANGTHVGIVIGADPDAGSVLGYTLLNDAGGRFAIDAATGALAVRTPVAASMAKRPPGVVEQCVAENAAGIRIGADHDADMGAVGDVAAHGAAEQRCRGRLFVGVGDMQGEVALDIDAILVGGAHRDVIGAAALVIHQPAVDDGDLAA